MTPIETERGPRRSPAALPRSAVGHTECVYDNSCITFTTPETLKNLHACENLYTLTFDYVYTHGGILNGSAAAQGVALQCAPQADDAAAHGMQQRIKALYFLKKDDGEGRGVAIAPRGHESTCSTLVNGKRQSP